MSDRGAIPWDEWEVEARRLHALLPLKGPSRLSSAQKMLARLLGHAHWHEVEEAQKNRDALPWKKTEPGLRGFPAVPSPVTCNSVVAWLSQVTPVAPTHWPKNQWVIQGAAVWTALAPLLVEGHQRGRWDLTGSVAITCLRPATWPHLQALEWSQTTQEAIHNFVKGLKTHGGQEDMATVAQHWREAWRAHLSKP